MDSVDFDDYEDYVPEMLPPVDIEMGKNDLRVDDEVEKKKGPTPARKKWVCLTWCLTWWIPVIFIF